MLARAKYLLVCAVCVGLGACASVHNCALETRLREDLHGMHREKVLACAGLPIRTAVTGEYEDLIYGGAGLLWSLRQANGLASSDSTASASNQTIPCKMRIRLHHGACRKPNSRTALAA